MRLRALLKNARINVDNKVISSLLPMARDTIAGENFFVSSFVETVFLNFVVSLKEMITEFSSSILTQL